MSRSFTSPADVMQRALELARRGEGFVEPNPLVGAVLVDDNLRLLGEGFHERFGGPHAEIVALAQAGARARGATLFVTLEPCCHFGKTPPCVDAVLAAGVAKVVVSLVDPFPEVSGRGIARLREAGLAVEVGLLAEQGAELTAPFRKLVEAGLPWVHAKWAMTLDGKLASRTGHSKWISNEASRACAHHLRGRMDAIFVGIGTALADDPELTARPPGPRVATRVILDAHARLAPSSRLVQTIAAAPLLVAVAADADESRVAALRAAGAEVLVLPVEKDPASQEQVAEDGVGRGAGRHGPALSLRALLVELGRRRFTNVLVEGGSALLGAFFDAGLLDEIHAFIAPKLVGGSAAKSPIGGAGNPQIPALASLRNSVVENFDGDLYIRGRLSS